MSRIRAIPVPHAWDVSPAQAIAIQQDMRGRVETSDRLGEVQRVAGVDVGFEEANTVTRAAVAVLDVESLALVEHCIVRRPTEFPYVPGLLSFREVPAVLEALERLRLWPDLVLCDGQGLAHPRRFGIACHLGVIADVPTIGVAKSRLIGAYEPVGTDKGAWSPLLAKEEVIGAVVRTRVGVQPVYVSIGHRISLPTAIDWVLRCTGRYRLPETTRWAHRLASDKTRREDADFDHLCAAPET